MPFAKTTPTISPLQISHMRPSIANNCESIKGSCPLYVARYTSSDNKAYLRTGEIAP